MPEGVLVNGLGRRRSWPDDLRAEILLEAFRPGAKVSEVGRRYDIATSQIYMWRKEALLRDRAQAPGFVEAMVPTVPVEPCAAHSGSLVGEPMISVVLANGHEVRILGSASPSLVSATLRALSQ